jgi:hypothetical protein
MWSIILLVLLFVAVVVMRTAHINNHELQRGERAFLIAEARLFCLYLVAAVAYFVLRGLEGAYSIFSAFSYWIIGGGIMLLLVYLITYWVIGEVVQPKLVLRKTR